MAGLCEGFNEPTGSLKANNKVCNYKRETSLSDPPSPLVRKRLRQAGRNSSRGKGSRVARTGCVIVQLITAETIARCAPSSHRSHTTLLMEVPKRRVLKIHQINGEIERNGIWFPEDGERRGAPLKPVYNVAIIQIFRDPDHTLDHQEVCFLHDKAVFEDKRNITAALTSSGNAELPGASQDLNTVGHFGGIMKDAADILMQERGHHSTESYPAFARIGLRENPGKNLNQITCSDRDSNPGHLVSRQEALTVTPQATEAGPATTSTCFIGYVTYTTLDQHLTTKFTRLLTLINGQQRKNNGVLA
ncbi:hypothetical protein ANN_14591 [Periplaneta americana]|uniref:Uncharacterized protein n=1 Tax=Periplaneta americana TaxID=6978 RepID=A0ABQ8SWN6_PERAM|nr:hypothetical protein ANN_14591 [Periplaneta americana]